MNQASRNMSNAVDAVTAIPAAVREIVIVDASCERYGEFVNAAQDGDISVHFCVDGRSAMRLAKRFRADVWLVAADLPDMSGFDLLEMLAPHVQQANVDPMLAGSRISLDRLGRAGMFVVSEAYRLEEEQRALAAGVTGYLVSPVSLGVVSTPRASSGRQLDVQPEALTRDGICS